jgi:NADH-quinone oxidoreductase subunit N
MSSWQMLAVVMVILGFAFKIAAVPLHVYAGDVYQGAATPVTALLSFVPKASGFVALLKMLYAVGGASWALPDQIIKLIWVLAVLTMTVGNVLGLLQQNVKRVLAYSSIAHSGYMLVGVATLLAARGETSTQLSALGAVIFYLTAYGIMNAAAFGVLMLLPAKPLPAWDRRPSTGSAETFEDIAGAGIAHLGLGLAMAVACFSLIGIPLTIGFFGKFYLIQAAWRGGNTWLVILMMINAAISAGYYLRIVGTMFQRPEPIGGIDVARAEPVHGVAAPTVGYAEPSTPTDQPLRRTPIVAAIILSCVGTVLFGVWLPATETLNTRASSATLIDQPIMPAVNPAEAPSVSARSVQ